MPAPSLQGVTYTSCTTTNEVDGLSWCSTRVQVSGAEQLYYATNPPTTWDYCKRDCPGYQPPQIQAAAYRGEVVRYHNTMLSCNLLMILS